MLQTNADFEIKDAATLILDPDLQGSVLVIFVDREPQEADPKHFRGLGCDDEGVFLETFEGDVRRLPSVEVQDFELAFEFNPAQTLLKEMSYATGRAREYGVNFLDNFVPNAGPSL